MHETENKFVYGACDAIRDECWSKTIVLTHIKVLLLKKNGLMSSVLIDHLILAYPEYGKAKIRCYMLKKGIQMLSLKNILWNSFIYFFN